MPERKERPEMPIIRPPSEWRSLLLRLTRGCRWNRCRFCGIYPHLGEPHFSIRGAAEVKHDIDLLRPLRPRARTAFIGDADPLEAGAAAFAGIARHLRRSFSLERLTCYARASTICKLKEGEVRSLAKAGLNRVHMGLESGDDNILRYHRKGQSARMVKKAARRLREAGIEISFYVLLGLGGSDRWQEHAERTAALINETGPNFVRLRRLWLYGDGDPGRGGQCPLWEEIRAGRFRPQTPEGTVIELRRLIASLDELPAFLACDHANNYIQVSGTLLDDKQDMLAEIDGFLGRPRQEREAHYREVGSRI